MGTPNVPDSARSARQEQWRSPPAPHTSRQPIYKGPCRARDTQWPARGRPRWWQQRLILMRHGASPWAGLRSLSLGEIALRRGPSSTTTAENRDPLDSGNIALSLWERGTIGVRAAVALIRGLSLQGLSPISGSRDRLYSSTSSGREAAAPDSGCCLASVRRARGRCRDSEVRHTIRNTTPSEPSSSAGASSR